MEVLCVGVGRVFVLGALNGLFGTCERIEMTLANSYHSLDEAL